MSISRSDYLKVVYGQLDDNIRSLINAQNINSLGNLNYSALQLQNNDAIRKAQDQTTASSTSDENWWTKFVDTVQDVGTNLVKGILNFGDAIFDFGVNVADAIAGGNNQWAKDITGYDWVSPTTRVFSMGGDLVSGRMFDSDYWTIENFNVEGSQNYLANQDENTYLNLLGENTADFIQNNLLQGIGFQIPSIALAASTGGGSAVAMGSMGAGALASQTNESYNETGDFARSLGSGVASALVEVGTELIGGKVLKGVGLGTGKVAGIFGKEAISEAGESAIKTVAKTMLEEGFEESLSGIMQPVVDSIAKGESAFYNENGQNVYGTWDFWVNGNDSVLMQGVSGGLIGGIFGGINQASMKRALGTDGTQYAYSMEKIGDLQKQINNTTSDAKRTKLSEEMAIELAKARVYLERVNQNATSEQKRNVLNLIQNPAQVINALKTNTDQSINDVINTQIQELGNINQFRARNFFNDLQSEFNTDFELVFDSANNENAYIDNENNVIHINENLSEDLAPILVHEYLGHVIGDLIPNSSVSDIFNSIKDTSWYNAHYSDLRASYLNDNNAQNFLNEQDKQAYYQKEVVNKYVENAFSNNSNTSIRTIRELLNRESKVQKFLNRLLNRSYATMLENDNIVKEFAKQVGKVLTIVNGANSNVVAKYINGETLTEKEQNLVEKYSSFFNELKRFIPSEEYSRTSSDSRVSVLNRIARNSKTRPVLSKVGVINDEQYITDGTFIVKLPKELEFADTDLIATEEENYPRVNLVWSILEENKYSLKREIVLNDLKKLNNEYKKAKFEAYERIFPIFDNGGIDVQRIIDIATLFKVKGNEQIVIETNEKAFAGKDSNRKNIAHIITPNGEGYIAPFIARDRFPKKVQDVLEKIKKGDYNIERSKPQVETQEEVNTPSEVVKTPRQLPTTTNDQLPSETRFDIETRNEPPRSFYEPTLFNLAENVGVDNLTPLETNEARRVKAITDNSLNSVITLKDTQAIYNRVLEKIKSDFGIDLKVPNKSQKARRLFDDFNLMNREFTRENISRFVEDILNQEIDGFGNITYRQFLAGRNINVEDYVKSNTNTLFNLLIDNSDESRTMKRFNRLFNELKTARDNLLATNKLLRNNASTIRNLENRIKNYGSDTKSVKGALNTLKSFLSSIRFTKQGVLSSTVLKNIHESVQDGSMQNMIKNILNPYDMIIDVHNLSPQANTLLQMAEDLSNSYVEKRPLDVEQILRVGDFVKGIKKLYEDFNKGVIEEARTEAKRLIETAKATKEAYKHAGNKFVSVANRLLLNYASPKTMFSFVFGGTNTDSFNNVYEELYKKPYERQIREYNHFKDLMLEKTKTLQKYRYAKVKGAKFRKYVLYQFYLNQKSPDNLERMINSTLTYTERKGVSRQYKFDELKALAETTLSPLEKSELDSLFNLYNDEVKTYVEKSSEKILGFATSRENYYPIVSSDVFRTTDFSNPANMRYNISAMNNNRLKALTNRKNHIEINVDPINLFDDYIESMTTTGEIGLESQKLNRLFQLKNENGESLLSTISSYLPNAKTFVASAFNKLIGNTQVIERNGLLDKLLGKSAVATLGINPATMLRQIGSLFTATRYTGGIARAIKTILTPTTYYRIYKNKEWLKTHNAVFENRIKNDGYVRGTTLSAGAMEFGNSILRKISKVSLLGIEYMDRFVCYTTFAFAQDFVKAKYGYGVNTEENLVRANEIFTDILLDTQSNSDRIAMSRLRAGEEGNFMKNVFSLFGSDNQNKLSVLMQDVIDFNNIRNNNSYDKSIRKGLMTKTKKYIVADVGAIVAGSILMAIINMLNDWALDREEPATYDYSTLFFDSLKSMFDWTPYFGTMLNWFVYGSVDYFPIENLNDLVSTCSQLIDVCSGNKKFDKQLATNLIEKILNLMGIPAENIKKYGLGILANFSPEVAYKTRNVLYGISQSYLNSQYQQGKEQNNFAKMLDSFELNSALYKATLSETNAREIVRLKKADFQINAYNVPETYTDKDGNEVKLTEEQKRNFKLVYDNLDGLLTKLISSATYRGVSDNEKASLINKAYQTYYEYALGRNGTRLSYLASLKGYDLSRLILATNENNNLHLSQEEKLLIKFISGKSLSESDRHALYLIFVRSGLKQALAKELLDL